jgi:hypothetical protein
MTTLKQKAITQVKQFLGQGKNKPDTLFWSTQQLKGELLYIEYSKFDKITNEEMSEIENTLNKGFKGHNITVEVRKHFFK